MSDPSFSILRIKRKRTTNQLPLDALGKLLIFYFISQLLLILSRYVPVIEQPEPSTKRRKATHHIPPSLLPQPQTTTTSRGSLSIPSLPFLSSHCNLADPIPLYAGIFRFAETVSLDSFDNPTKTRQVKVRFLSSSLSLSLLLLLTSHSSKNTGSYLFLPPPSATPLPASPRSNPFLRISSQQHLILFLFDCPFPLLYPNPKDPQTSFISCTTSFEFETWYCIPIRTRRRRGITSRLIRPYNDRIKTRSFNSLPPREETSTVPNH